MILIMFTTFAEASVVKEGERRKTKGTWSREQGGARLGYKVQIKKQK